MILSVEAIFSSVNSLKISISMYTKAYMNYEQYNHQIIYHRITLPFGHMQIKKRHIQIEYTKKYSARTLPEQKMFSLSRRFENS